MNRYLEKRIEHILKDRWCSHSTRKEREQFYVKFELDIKSYIYRHGRSKTPRPGYNQIGNAMTHLGLWSYAMNLYPEAFQRYCIRSIECSIYCIENDIEMVKLPHFFIKVGQRNVFQRELDSVREWLSKEPKESLQSGNEEENLLYRSLYILTLRIICH